MKNKVMVLQTLGCISLALVAVLFLIGCPTDDDGGGDSPLTVADFFGTWTRADGEFYSISATEISWSHGLLGGQDHKLLTALKALNVNELNNADFPSGFSFSSGGGLKTLYMSVKRDRFMDGEDMEIYAKWKPFTVTYNINGGTGTTPTAQTMSGVRNYIILAGGSGFSRSGYTFGGWNTDATGTGTNYAEDTNYMPAGNITLYARWDQLYTITYPK